MKRIAAFVRRRWLYIRTVLLFIGAIGVWIIWYPKLVDGQVLSGYLDFIARLCGGILGLLGANVEVSGTTISSAIFSIEIGHECTAIVPMVLLICVVMAYPSRFRTKAICIGGGIVLLFLLNLMRVVSLYYIGIWAPRYFETAHFIVWQSLMILAVVAIWLFWAQKAAHVRST